MKISQYSDGGTPSATDEFIAARSGSNVKILWSAIEAVFALAAKGVTGGDSHDHNGGDGAAIVEAAITLADNTTNNASTTKHGFLIKATAPAAGIRNVVAIDNAETVYKNTALVDNTNPAAIGTVAPGTSLLAARRDHVHAITTVPTSFQPAVTGTTDAGSGTYTTQNGYYAKVGPVVFYTILLVWTAHTGTGNTRVTGLPVTSADNGTPSPAALGWSSITLTNDGDKLQAQVEPNTSYIAVSRVLGGARGALALDTAGSLWLSGFYFV